MAVDRELMDALTAPLGELIASIGRGVAEAQRALDADSLAALREIYESDEDFYRELQALGYRPTWYHIPEAEGQIQVALTVSGQDTVPPAGEGPVPRSRIRLYAAPLDAGYTSRYTFSLTASSSLRFRIVPVPPSAAAEAIRIMPSLVGLHLSEAGSRLSQLGLETTLPDAPAATLVTSQEPAPGTVVEPDTEVTVGIA